MRSVREIEAGDVHAGSEKLLDHGDGARSRAQSADDLRLRPHVADADLLFSSIADKVVRHLLSLSLSVCGSVCENVCNIYIEV